MLTRCRITCNTNNKNILKRFRSHQQPPGVSKGRVMTSNVISKEFHKRSKLQEYSRQNSQPSFILNISSKLPFTRIFFKNRRLRVFLENIVGGQKCFPRIKLKIYLEILVCHIEDLYEGGRCTYVDV